MSSSAERQEERIRLNLIAYVTQHTVDQDYAVVQARADAPGGPRSRVGAAVMLAVFAVLIVTAASQTTRNSASATRERGELIDQIDARRESLDARSDQARSLTLTNDRLRTEQSAGSRSSLSATVRRLRTSTGAVAVRGPGLVLVADDKAGATSDREHVFDTDLQHLVNGLWEAGAEAVSINGQRISNLTAIRDAGGTINVNYAPLQPPYTVRAIGDPDTLASRFADSTSGAAWFDLVQQVGLRLQINTSQRLDLPATARLDLRYAQRTEGGPS